MAPDTINDNLTAAITWALERMVKGEFKEAHDAAGNLDSMVLDRDFGPVNAAHARLAMSHAGRGGSPGHHISAESQAELTATRYGREIQKLFPGLIRRAEALGSVPEIGELPEYVRRFLTEALRCIVYGQFLAALFLCRSALSEAIVVTLRNKGHGEKLNEMKEDGLKGIFKLAHEHGLLDSTLHQSANNVRHLTNQAIHSPKAPSEEECISAFATTVKVVRVCPPEFSQSAYHPGIGDGRRGVQGLPTPLAKMTAFALARN